MKISLFPIAVLMATGLILLANNVSDPNNPPTGRTGAPGETTCGASNCHSGGTYTGTVSISGIPDTVTPSTTYTVTLTNTSNAVKAGFELTCLVNGTNTMCGTLIAASGVSIGTGTGGRKYARQSTPKNLSNGSTSWNFTWKSPAVAVDSAIFYFVSLCANGNGQKTGDNPILATKQIVFASAASPVTEPGSEVPLKMYPTVVGQGILNIELLEASKGSLSIIDAQGKICITAPLAAANQVDVSQLPTGIYLANIATEGKATVKKFIVK